MFQGLERLQITLILGVWTSQNGTSNSLTLVLLEFAQEIHRRESTANVTARVQVQIDVSLAMAKSGIKDFCICKNSTVLQPAVHGCVEAMCTHKCDFCNSFTYLSIPVCFGSRFGPVDTISSWLGRLPGTIGGIPYMSGKWLWQVVIPVLCFAGAHHGQHRGQHRGQESS